MNRVIKFRAWNKLEKIMLDNSDLVKTAIRLSGEINNAYPLLNLAATLETNEVFETYVLQQFTGLFDKNNKEIYEGDIIKDTWKVNYPYGYRPDEFTDDQSIFEVKYFAPSFNLEIKRSGDQTCIEDFEREVIGNIFENPDLIK